MRDPWPQMREIQPHKQDYRQQQQNRKENRVGLRDLQILRVENSAQTLIQPRFQLQMLLSDNGPDLAVKGHIILANHIRGVQQQTDHHFGLPRRSLVKRLFPSPLK